MKLIGRNLSPYTRRVAVALDLLGYRHEREYLSVTQDPARGLAVNPVGRVPVLVLDDGEHLIESGAILDYLMEQAGPAKALIPPSGKARLACLQTMAVATGVLDKAVAAIYEQRRRPAEKLHEPWRQHLLSQVTGGLVMLEAKVAALGANGWFGGAKPDMADITVGVMMSFLGAMVPEAAPHGHYPALEKFRDRCEALPAFKAHPLEKL